MKKLFKSTTLALGLGLLLSSCSSIRDPYFTKALWGSPEFLAMGVAVDLAYAKKTPVGHVVSWITGRNCSILRVEAGKSYCEPKEKFVQAEEHCYKTLGGIDCYTDEQNQYGEEVGDTYIPTTKKEQRRKTVHDYYRNKAQRQEHQRQNNERYRTDQYPDGQ